MAGRNGVSLTENRPNTPEAADLIVTLIEYHAPSKMEIPSYLVSLRLIFSLTLDNSHETEKCIPKSNPKDSVSPSTHKYARKLTLLPRYFKYEFFCDTSNKVHFFLT